MPFYWYWVWTAVLRKSMPSKAYTKPSKSGAQKLWSVAWSPSRPKSIPKEPFHHLVPPSWTCSYWKESEIFINAPSFTRFKWYSTYSDVSSRQKEHRQNRDSLHSRAVTLVRSCNLDIKLVVSLSQKVVDLNPFHQRYYLTALPLWSYRLYLSLNNLLLAWDASQEIDIPA